MAFVFFSAGLVFLIVGAEALVRGASRFALGFGISPLIIGLTVVAFGTSSPELAVSVKAALSGQSGVAVGNVIGSNIFNVLFILGLSALIVPLVVSKQLLRLDVPVMIALSMFVLLLSLDGSVSRADGTILVLGLAGYIGVLIYLSRKASTDRNKERTERNNEGSKESGDVNRSGSSTLRNSLLVLGGLVLLVLGSRWLVDGAVSFAQYMGVSELIIGLTIVAAGTSLPEVVTSVIAAIRGQRDIAVGNVIGSNIFNLMGVLGVAGIVAPSGINVPPAVIGFDLPVMIAVAFACLPIFFTGGGISRPEGSLFLGYYVMYTMYIILVATQHDALPEFGTVALYFLIPLTVITLTVSALLEIRRRSHER
ncbi:calcium/sodium antiporter [Marinobacter sp. ELB17]|uniref:calcium/sodium antiporter n=1 Tax=Marinobacter sp. ELB17 TaxID=270374 RepID=UPI0000F39D34|nr:calcium/sodium antiporter [Marinobacter sp. ELB17]EAZ98891.1 K+-dependent Na+/Ca+ exchanger related-protein [Marinobacter sp. ELB17]